MLRNDLFTPYFVSIPVFLLHYLSAKFQLIFSLLFGSAGVGRSGTFIVIDSMLARIHQEQTVDIYNFVRYLRTRRMYMVQTDVNIVNLPFYNQIQL